MIFALAALLLPAAQQETVLEADSITPREEGDAIIYVLERPRLISEEVRLNCERATLTLDAARYRLALESGLPRAQGDIEDPEPTAAGTVLPGLWSRKILRGLGLPEDETLIRAITLEGAVRMVTAEFELVAESVHDEPAAGRLRVLGTRITFVPGSIGPNGWPVSLYAETLEEESDGSLRATEALLTTCSEEEPHYGLRLGAVRVTRREDGALRWEPERGWLEIFGAKILPLPTPDFVPGESFLGLHGARGGNDRKLGTALELQFRGSERFGGTVADWNLYPMFSTRRGFPLSGEVDLRAADYRGHWELFFLQDEASDQSGLARAVGRDGDSRWRVRMDNVWDLSDHWRAYGVLDLTSDPLVDPEFFQQSWVNGEDIRSELSFVRSDDNSWAYVGVTPRLDDSGATPLGGYPSAPGPAPQTTEALPRLSWEEFSTTLTELPVPVFGGDDRKAAVNVAYGAEIARLRKRDRNLVAPGPVEFLDTPSLTRSRARAWAEIALPAHGSGFFVRPGARFAGALWEDDTPGAAQDQQVTAEGFVEIGTALEKRWEDGWAHRVVPLIRLRAREEAIEADFVPPTLDGLDRLTEGEVIEFSVRQFFLEPGAISPWLDLDLLAPFYPDDGEVLAPVEGPVPWSATIAEQGFGPVELRAVWSPGAPGSPLEGVRADARLRRDFAEDVTQEVFTRVTLRPDESLFYGIEFYETEGTPGDFAYGSVFAGWRFTERWAAGLRQSENFSGAAGVQTGYAMQYYGHDFLFEAGYTRQQATGDLGLYFNITPRFFFDPYGGRKLARLHWQ